MGPCLVLLTHIDIAHTDVTSHITWLSILVANTPKFLI